MTTLPKVCSMNAGGYRFTDFVKVGVPLNLIFLAVAVYFIPKFWQF